MSNYVVLGVKKRSLAGARGMAKHALRELLCPHADPARLNENELLAGPGTVAEVMQRLKSTTLPLMRRKDAVRCVELLITASPEAMHGKSLAEQNAYFKDALGWVGERFGGAGNVLLAVVHRDEATPHMQVLLMPILDGKLAAKELLGGPSGMLKMHDDFAAQVGKPHGLRRGERGSPAKHEEVAVFHRAIAVAGSVDALPRRRRIPALPPVPVEPWLFAGAEKKKEYAEALKTRSRAIAARAAAVEHNKARERAVDALARVGIATKGKQARGIAQRIAALETREASVNAEAERLIEYGRDASRLAAAARAALEALPEPAREQVLAVRRTERQQQPPQAPARARRMR